LWSPPALRSPRRISYLESVFAAIDRQFGSLDNYRRTALGVSDVDLVTLKARLLEN
jgi:protein-tyrosine phosphatase